MNMYFPEKPPLLQPSVSIIVPVRDEAGNIEELAARIPPMGPADEIIFIEGGSSDGTWDRVQEVVRASGGRRISAYRQDGRGKGDAVRKGFSLAVNDILMVFDADMSVAPDELPRFYHALVSGEGEFINGSRFILPMEKGAMSVLNLIGNKFFALAVSWIMRFPFTDVLCGTKALKREHYVKFPEDVRDPWGDLDLISGAHSLGSKIVEIPVTYRRRVSGRTKLSPWRHGAELLGWLVSSALRQKPA